jgi:hypothetical protein
MQNIRKLFFGEPGDYHLGYAISKNSTHHIGLDGKPAYAERYDLVEPFQKEGDKLLAWARQGAKWIRIDPQGKEVKMKTTSIVA